MLYPLVAEHAETLFAEAQQRTEHGYGYPLFVEQTFRQYLDCGQLQNGFTRLRCSGCGFERLLAFSCKRRGLCPSCEARRMEDTAAHLVDRVLPTAPYRQWVLSLPMELRLRLLKDKTLVSEVLRLFVRRIAAYQRREARKMGIADAKTGSVTFIQRWGGALNANVHYHSVVPDGVFDVRSDGAVQFVPLLSPTDADIENICGQVARRVQRLLEARGEFAEATDVDEGLGLGLEAATSPSRNWPQQDTWEHPPKPKKRCAAVEGFSLHAGVTVAAQDRKGLARLCRYGLRSSFSLERLSRRDDGRVCYKLKRPWPHPGGITELVLHPVALLRRLAALIPPKRANLVRYHGVFAPNARLRRQVLPRFERAADCPPQQRTADLTTRPTPARDPKPAAHPQASDDLPILVLGLTSDAGTQLADEPPLSLLGPTPDPKTLRPIRQRRLDWATLLKKVHTIDVVDCPRCPERLTVVAAISDPPIVRKILDHLNLPTATKMMAPARAPPQQDFNFSQA